MVEITVPREYGYVLLTATASFFVSFWHGARVGPFRKAAEVPYPSVLATNDDIAKVDNPKQKHAMYLFNCAQRAHYNFLENYNSILPALLIGGLKNPVASAAFGSAWLVCRIMYAVGYTRSDKEKGQGRLIGSGHYICALALYGMAASLGWSLLK